MNYNLRTRLLKHGGKPVTEIGVHKFGNYTEVPVIMWKSRNHNSLEV